VGLAWFAVLFVVCANAAMPDNKAITNRKLRIFIYNSFFLVGKCVDWVKFILCLMPSNKWLIEPQMYSFIIWVGLSCI
jgi:hypothetical protein